MDQQELNSSLHKLRDEIAAISDNQAARDRLIQIVDDIKSAGAVPAEEDHHGLLQGIQESIEEFEAEHPRATAILNDIMVTLSNMGI